MSDLPKKRVYKKKPVIQTPTPVPENTIVAPEEKPSCGVCLEPYNKVANTQVTCCFCQESSCRRCIQTFISSTTNDPHCMHCKKAWEREFIDDNLTATYRMNDYKRHRENILLERELALMPATQYRAEQIKEADKLASEVLPPFDKQLKELYEQSADITKKINAVYAIRSETQYQIRLLRTGTGTKEKAESTFIRKCPDSECRGFLSTAWKCGLCSKWACPECHEIKGENRDAPHECNP